MSERSDVSCFCEWHTATSEIQTISDDLRVDIQADYADTFAAFTVLTYRTEEVTDGTIYFIRIDVGLEVYVQIKVVQNVDLTFTLESVATLEKAGILESVVTLEKAGMYFILSNLIIKFIEVVFQS